MVLLYHVLCKKKKEGMTGMILYNKRNTSYFRKHVVTAPNRVFYQFLLHLWRPKVMAGDDEYPLYGSVETPLTLSGRKMPNDESSCISAMTNYFVWKRSYGPNHPHQIEDEDHLLTMMAHAYTPLSLVEGDEFHRMVTNLDPYI